MQRVTLPAWVRAITGAFGTILLLVGIGSAPQAVRDTLANLPFLSHPVPWGALLALAVFLCYAALILLG